MKGRIWIILAALLLCNAIGLAVLMANSEANAAELNNALPKAAAKATAPALFNSIIVNTTLDEDSGSGAAGTRCSLREAIIAANTDTAYNGCAQGSGADVISFDATVFASSSPAKIIDLATALPNISSNLTIQGSGRAWLVVQRANGAADFRVFTIGNTVTAATISGLTICNGKGLALNGTGLQNAGKLTLNDVVVTANNVDAYYEDPVGSGIFINHATNNGGGIENLGTGDLTLNNCEVTGNFAGQGGGIYNAGQLTMTLTTIGNNDATPNAGGGLFNLGTVVAGNLTGGIVTMSRGVFKGNRAEVGGGIYNATGGSITLTNVSLGDNETHDGGGLAIYIDGNTATNPSTVTLRNVTVGLQEFVSTGDPELDNAIYVANNAIIKYRNSIFASAATGFSNFTNHGTLDSEGFNICNDDTAVLDATGDQPANTDPKLGTGGLQTYQPQNPNKLDTYILLCDSPAIDAGSNSLGTDPTSDARGVARVGTPDIGSYEYNYQITTASPLTGFAQNTFKSVILTTEGGDSPYTYSLAAGSSLPAGLQIVNTPVLNGSGGVIDVINKLEGTPTVSGSFSFTLSVNSHFGGYCATTKSFTMEITGGCSTITVSPASLPAATCDSTYADQAFSASGGTGPYTFKVLSGDLPPGMTLTNGVLGGKPTAPGAYNFTICATDTNGCTGSQAYTLMVNCPTITVTNPVVAAGTVGTSFNQSFTANKPGMSFSLNSGTLPAGLTLSAAGVLSGTPMQSGTFAITVRASITANGTTCMGVGTTYNLTINCPTIGITPATLSLTQGISINQSLTATPGTLTYSYKLLSGTLPAGLNLSAGGLLTGAPLASGAYSFTVCATAQGMTGTACTGSQTYAGTIINSAPTITPAGALSRQQGSPAGAAVTVATVSDGANTNSLVVTQIAGGTATGITLTNITNTNGTITAQVAAGCSATGGTVCLQVSDGDLTNKGNLTVNVTADVAPTLTYNAPEPVCFGMSATINPATGPSDNGSVSSIVLQSVSPSVPAGSLSVNNSTGVITVNNTVPSGLYTVTVRATDNCNKTTDATLTLNVVGSLILSEFRLSGPGGQNDWYVELYNSTAAAINTTGLKLGVINQDGSQVVSYDLPTNVSIPARSYYLIAGSAYSLSSSASANLTAPALVPGFNLAGAGLFKGAVTDATKRIDSVGMSTVAVGATYRFYVETAPVPGLANTTAQHAFVRKFVNGLPTDTNNNATDFILISTTATAINGITPQPGTPGPQNASSPLPNNAGVPFTLFNTSVGANVSPNQFVENVATTVDGTTYARQLYLRRKVTNNTGSTITKLRFRIIEMSNGGTNTASLRALNPISPEDVMVNGQPVKGLTLEAPAVNTGGLNSTLCVGTIALPVQLANTASVNVQFRLGVLQGGSYRFFVNVEPLLAGPGQ